MGWISRFLHGATDTLGITDTSGTEEAKINEAKAKQLADKAAAEAAAETARITKQKTDYAQSLQELQAQETTNLNTNTLTNVVAGGTAADSESSMLKRKKLSAPTLSTQLGINV